MNRLLAAALLSTAVWGWPALSAGAQETPTTLIPAVTVTAPTSSELGALATESLSDNGATRVEVFEDGSGVQLINGTAVRSFPADTFVWDCSVHGNRICGPTLPETK